MLRIKQDIRNSILMRMLRRLKKAMYRFKKFSQKEYIKFYRTIKDYTKLVGIRGERIKSIEVQFVNYDSLISS